MPTIKLAASYLTIIMVMSIISSLVFYNTSARELNSRPDAEYYSQTNYRDPDHELDEWLGRRADEGQGSLLMNLTLINSAMLLGGSIFSYVLARRTLKPIEEAMQMQSRFIADASHELRTPLTAILLNNEMALRRRQLSSDDVHKIIKRNIEDINHLTALSDELLDLTNTSHNSPQLTAIDLRDIVDTAVDHIKSAAHKKNKKIHIEVKETSIRTNRSILEKIVVILLDNAIKYSPKDRSIAIFTEHKENHLLLHVQDYGPGIKKEDIPNIFNRFYRADESRSEVDGHGLGLAIAKQLADDLHYKISAKSVYESGTTFTVMIPVG